MVYIQSYNLSTINSDNSYISSPAFHLVEPIRNPISYQVDSFIGANSFYTIDSRNDSFKFSENDSPGTIREALIPTGNYNITTYLVALKTALDAAGTVVYTVTNNNLINKITISAASKLFNIINSSGLYESGFIINSTFAASHIAPNTFDLSGVKQLNIISNSMGFSSKVVNRNLNVVCSIPIDSAYLGVIYYKNSNPSYIDCKVSEINSFEFNVYDERFRLLSQIDRDWSITLNFNFE